MTVSTREAMRIALKHNLEFAVEEGMIDLTPKQIEGFVIAVEDDSTFHEKIAETMAEYIEDFGENYGLFDDE